MTISKSVVDRIMEAAAEEAWKAAQPRIRALKTAKFYSKYKSDPVGFGEEVLGEFYTQDEKAVMRSVCDNPVTIARSGNALGKTHIAARLCVWGYLTHPESKIYVTAAPPIDNLKHILWGEIMSVVRKRPDLFDGHTITSLEISRNQKESFITGVAIPTSGTSAEREGKFAGKHAPFLMFMVDEGDAVPDEVYKGIESCNSGGLNRLLIMFNPRAQFGPVYMREKKRLANVVHLSAFRHPNVVSGEDVIPGAVSREVTVRRINEWTRPLMTDEAEDAQCFTVPEFLVGTVAQGMDGVQYPPLQGGTRKVVEPEFSYMVLGEYPSQSSFQLISETWIDAAVSRWHTYVATYGEIPPTGVRPILGVDMAEHGADFNVACLRYGGWIPKMTFWQGVDPDMAAEKSIELYFKVGAKIAMIDGTGVGAGVAPSMARRGRKDDEKGRSEDLRAISVKVASKPSPTIKTDKGEFKLLRDQIWWALREWLRTDAGAMLPPDPYLLEELRAVEYHKINGKIMVTPKDEMRERLKRSPDRADALCLTFSPYERASWVSVGAAHEAVTSESYVPPPAASRSHHKPGQNSRSARDEFMTRLEERRRINSGEYYAKEELSPAEPIATWTE